MTKRDFSLTGNEIAVAQFGALLAISWWKKQKPSDHGRAEISKLEALAQKLDAMNEYAYPYNSVWVDADCGGEVLLVANDAAVAKTRRRAMKVNRDMSAQGLA